MQACRISFKKETTNVCLEYNTCIMFLLFSLPVNVPSACAAFPREILFHPESLLRSKYTNLIQYNDLPRGGHFAALEEPTLLANDIFEFVSKTEDIRKNKLTTKISQMQRGK